IAGECAKLLPRLGFEDVNVHCLFLSALDDMSGNISIRKTPIRCVFPRTILTASDSRVHCVEILRYGPCERCDEGTGPRPFRLDRSATAAVDVARVARCSSAAADYPMHWPAVALSGAASSVAEPVVETTGGPSSGSTCG